MIYFTNNNEFYEVISHIPLQYFNNIDNIKIGILESNNNIYDEISKYKIKNIIRIDNINNIVDNYDIIIIENNNFDDKIINKIISQTKIIMIPDKYVSIWSYSYWINKNSDINIKNKYRLKVDNKYINFYSNIIDPLRYFVNYNNYNKNNIITKYYNSQNHWKYFIDYKDTNNSNIILGAHIMLDFDNVDYNLLEDTDYIKTLMKDIATEEKFIILNTVCHKFEPHGFTMLFLLSTSHFSIHTYPEHNKCSIDLYSCDMNVDYNNVITRLRDGLKSDVFRLNQCIRY